MVWLRFVVPPLGGFDTLVSRLKAELRTAGKVAIWVLGAKCRRIYDGSFLNNSGDLSDRGY